MWSSIEVILLGYDIGKWFTFTKFIINGYGCAIRICNWFYLSTTHSFYTKNKISKTLKKKYETQEHHSKGKPSWNKDLKMKKIECPYCNKMVDKGNGKRWHFENCKFKTPS